MQRDPRKICNPLQSGPWPVLGKETGEGGRIPVRGVAGGEVLGGEKVEEAEGYLVVGRNRVGDDRTGSAARSRGMATEVFVDSGSPVVDWQEGVVNELRWSKAKLLGCLEGAGKYWSGGSTAE